MRSKKYNIFFLTVVFLLFLACLTGIHATSSVNDTDEGNDDNNIYKSGEDNSKIIADKKSGLNITVNKVKTNNYLTKTKITGKITTEDNKLPKDKYIHLYVNNKKQSKTGFKVYENGTYQYTTKQNIGNHTFKIYINDTKYQTKKTSTNFTVTDKIFPTLNKSRPIYFAMDHTNRKDRQICNNIVNKLEQEGFKVKRYKIGPNAMYQNMAYLYKNNIHNAIMFHLFNGVDPSNIREVATHGSDNRGRIVRQRGNDVVLAWFYDASDPVHVGGNCYKSVRASETGRRLYNPKQYMDENNIYYICTSSDHYKHKSTADYNGDRTTLEFMKFFTDNKNLKYQTKTKASVTLSHDNLITITGTVTYPAGSVNGYAKVVDKNNKIITDNILVKNNKFTAKFISKNVGKQNYTIIYKGSPIYSTSNKTVTTTITPKNITIYARQKGRIIEDNSVLVRLTETRTGELLADQIVKIKADGKLHEFYTDANGSILAKIDIKRNQTIKIYAYNDKKLFNTKSLRVSVYKQKVNVRLGSIRGTVGENITLRASVADSNQNPVDDGYVLFKLNGKYLRQDNRIGTNKKILKFKVVNGSATYTLRGDISFNEGNFTAVYCGTNRYKNASSNAVVAVIDKREAKISVSVNKTGTRISFVASVRDTGKSNELLSENAVVTFNVNDKKVVRIKVGADAKAMYTTSLSSIRKLVEDDDGVVFCEYVNRYYVDASCSRKFRV